MLPFFIPLLVAYYLFWLRKRPDLSRFSREHEPVAVVIPLRNEDEHLGQLFSSLSALHLDINDEIILVDDASTNALSLENQPTLKAKVIRREAAKGSKKLALTLGINASAAPWVLCSDADCTHDPLWVESIRKSLVPGLRTLVGPVLTKQEAQKGWLNTISVYESACLWGISKQAIRWKTPILCSGANLCFRKSDWEDLGGYSSHLEHPSGDDVLLLRAFYDASPEGIEYCDIPEAVVLTESPKTWDDWYRQRKRWASKTAHVQGWAQTLQALFVLLWMLAPLILLFWNPYALVVLWVLEVIWIQDESVRLKQEFSLPKYLVFRLVYPLLLVKLLWVKKQPWKP